MWEKIKKILQKEGGKCIIVEADQPSYLVMRLDEYQRKLENQGLLEKEIEEVNRDITELKAEEAEEEIRDSEKEKVEVEDLPF